MPRSKKETRGCLCWVGVRVAKVGCQTVPRFRPTRSNSFQRHDNECPDLRFLFLALPFRNLRPLWPPRRHRFKAIRPANRDCPYCGFRCHPRPRLFRLGESEL
jgi:hypothetical protein